jgi:hypoxanthine-guanine phosphoribosyltransferase
MTQKLAAQLNFLLQYKDVHIRPCYLLAIARAGIPFARLLSGGLSFQHDFIVVPSPKNDAGRLGFEGLISDTSDESIFIVADTICDTGRTFACVNEIFAHDEDLFTVTLLRRKDYTLRPTLSGYTVPCGCWFYGFGLDDQEGENRHLNYIMTEEIKRVPAEKVVVPAAAPTPKAETKIEVRHD